MHSHGLVHDLAVRHSVLPAMHVQASMSDPCGSENPAWCALHLACDGACACPPNAPVPEQGNRGLVLKGAITAQVLV